jgi:RNA polymerase sigma-70 factor (TIGR02943 family)
VIGRVLGLSILLFITFALLLEPVHIIDPNNWVNNYADELYAFAMSKTDKAELAEDLVQETFLAGLKSLKNFEGKSSERTWLYSILKFKIADHYRKASTRREIPRSKLEINEDEGSDLYFNEEGGWKDASRPKDWGIDYSCPVESKELSIALSNCIEKLNHNQKQLVILKLVNEIEVEKICKELKISATNYWVIIHRAKLQLRSCLEQNWFKL